MTAALQASALRHGSPALARVAAGGLCAGCGACAALAPGRVTMAMAEPGWLRPRVAAAPEPAEEAAIAAVCPGLGQRVDAAGRRTSPLWGPYLTMAAGHAADPVLRHAGASGGVLTALCAHLLAAGEVEAVVATAPDPADPPGNAPCVATDRTGLLAAAGSRYAPSAPLADLPARLAEHRAHGRRFAFVGKPCDAAALRAMAGRDPQVAAAFPVILSFFCAGVPSRAGAAALLAALGADPARVVALRYRGQGWPGRAVATMDDATTLSMGYAESWGRILSRHLQHRCKICADGTGTAADLVCADAWDCDEAGYPRFEEGEGTSLVVARTARGAAILAAAEAAGRVVLGPFDPAALAAMQPGQRDRRRALLARLLALRLLGRPVPRYRGLGIVRAALGGRPGRQVANFIGMLRRARRLPPAGAGESR